MYIATHVQPTSAMTDVKDMGWQMGYRSLVNYKPRMELAERSHEQTYWGRNC